jgi:hypothetical protein
MSSKQFETVSVQDARSNTKTIGLKVEYGTAIDSNYGSSKLNPTNVYVGSAYTQGQVVRSLFDLNDNGTLLYSSTPLDQSNIITAYQSIFNLYPNLIEFPYLSLNYADVPETSSTKLYPLFNYSGKGFGEIEFYALGSSTDGLVFTCSPEYLSFYYTNIFRDRISIAEPQNFNQARYPFSGQCYSGNLMQLKMEPGPDSFQSIHVMPYQSGRGIPQYDPLSEYFSGDAYGLPYWMDVNTPIESELSMGCVPGNNDSCLGVSLDTENQNQNDMIYKYKVPIGYDLKYPWMKYYNHPAPFTAPPKNISFTRTDRIFSPENSNDNYYAPWPTYYAYHDQDAVPLLHQGLVTCSIGAAFNIGAQAYYEPDVIEGDDPRGNPNYLAISCVPLFQGEEIYVGSYAYANCLGHIITPLPVGTSPYPAPSYCDASGNISTIPLSLPNIGVPYFGIQRDARRDNPWYDWYDSTYGCVGWTGTPNFILSSIPDQGMAIVETRNGLALPYLNQANQGSVIIQAKSTTNTVDEGGSGRMTLIGDPQYDVDNDRMIKFPGSVERSLCVGKVMQCIQGTGRWTYTGQIFNFEQTDFVIGYAYTTTPPLNIYSTRGGSGSGATIEVLTTGVGLSVTSATLNSPGMGYTDGDVLQLRDNLPGFIEFGRGTLTYFRNSASVILNNNIITLNPGGSGYVSSIYEKGFNISANNLIVEATCEINVYTQQNNALLSFITSASPAVLEDVSRYPLGTLVQIMNDSNPYNWATAQVTSNNGTTITLDIVQKGGRNVYQTGTYLYSTQIVGFQQVAVSIQASNGIITEVQMIDIPSENKEDDLILIPQKGSNMNCIFQLKNNVSRIQSFSFKQIKGGAGYVHNPSIIGDSALLAGTSNTLFGGLNHATLNNPGQIDANQDMLIGGVDRTTLTQVSFYPNINNAFTGEFGNIQTVVQYYPIDLATQPVAGAQPTDGWESYVRVQNATFVLDVRFFIQDGGTGYSIGGPFTVTGGSGTNMEVFILSVSSTGSIEKLKLNSIGSSYQYLDNITIDGGNNDSNVVLKVPTTREIGPYMQTQFNWQEPILYFNCIIDEPGTGYSVGGPYDTFLPKYNTNYTFAGPFEVGIEMKVRINSVGPNGEVLDVEMVLPPPVITDAYWAYQTSYRIRIESGNSDCFVTLGRPIKAKRLEFTNQGTNYSTADDVSTLNLTQNNLVLICGFGTSGVGECEVIDYTGTDERPNFWDLRRYQVGDVLALNQNGNVSATAEITAINLLDGSISFNQLTFGTGYVVPTSSAYGFVPTINLANTATTVDIIADSNGEVTQLSNIQLGTNVEYNDACVIQQVGSDENVVFRIAGQQDVPPTWQPFTNGRNATAIEWNNYKQVVKSAKNLLDQRILIDFDKYYPNYYDNSWYFYGQPDNKDPNGAGFAIPTLPYD